MLAMTVRAVVGRAGTARDSGLATLSLEPWFGVLTRGVMPVSPLQPEAASAARTRQCHWHLLPASARRLGVCANWNVEKMPSV